MQGFQRYKKHGDLSSLESMPGYLARLTKSRHNRAKFMPSTFRILTSIEASQSGITTSELMEKNFGASRRTIQNYIAQLIKEGKVVARGEGHARRYFPQVSTTPDIEGQQHLAIKQNVAEPDPLRLAWRALIKHTIHHIITHPELDPLITIAEKVTQEVPEADCDNVQALIIEELRRIHEGVLARYGVRPSKFEHWKRINS